jgi:methylated-DNA-protein-cysteine methyltransferase-like protein
VPTQIDGIYSRIYRCVACIPEGKVATYGQIAKLMDASGARQVGYALSSTPADVEIPWHRVINARGEISQRSDSEGDNTQLQRLIGEGVVPNKHGRINLLRYRWQPSLEDFLNDKMDDEEFWFDQPGVG